MKRVLIANRGEIAIRIARSCRKLGLETVAVYSDADEVGWHVGAADFAIRLGPASALESYLSADRILEAAKLSGADAVHPGYGFLSENAAFAEACRQAGLNFIGPRSEHILKLGSKSSARHIATELGVPVLRGYDGEAQDDQTLGQAAIGLGYPVLIKASAGGGGRGMRVVRTPEALVENLRLARQEALAGFGDERLVLERYIECARHIEVQVIGDGRGHCVHLGDRECSVQRSYQKVVEEAPAPDISDETRKAIRCHAIALAQAVNYESLGTVEFILYTATGKAYFLEMNTRIQVEHPVTEMVTNLDLVELQLRVADEGVLPITQEDVHLAGAAIEVRVLAERPDKGFAPQSGVIGGYQEPVGPGLRIDTGIGEGTRITAFYDSLLSKLVVWGMDREQALARALQGLDDYRIDGVETNIGLLKRILQHDRFRSSTATTRWLDEGLDDLLPREDSERFARLARMVAPALLAEGEVSSFSGRSVWQSLGGWRLTMAAGFPAVSTWRLLDEGGREHRIQVRGRAGLYGVATGEEWQAVRVTHGGSDRVLIGDGILGETIRLVRDGKKITIEDRDGLSVFRLAGPIEGGVIKGETGESGSIVCAPLPGAIVEMRVAPGDRIATGATVATIESMKMVHSLSAPSDGTVSEVLCSPGDVVAQGERLIVIAPDMKAGAPNDCSRQQGGRNE